MFSNLIVSLALSVDYVALLEFIKLLHLLKKKMKKSFA